MTPLEIIGLFGLGWIIYDVLNWISKYRITLRFVKGDAKVGISGSKDFLDRQKEILLNDGWIQK